MQRTTRREGLEVLGRRPKHVAKLRLEIVTDRHDLAELVDVLLRGFYLAVDTELLVRSRAHDTYILNTCSQSHPSFSLTAVRKVLSL